MSGKNKPPVTCEFDGKMASLRENGREIAYSPAMKSSMLDRLHFEGDSVMTKNGPHSSGPVTGADMYDAAMRTKGDGFQVDKQSAVGGVCDVELSDGRTFNDVPMKVVPPAFGR